MRSFIFILIAALFLGSAAYLGNMFLFPRAVTKTLVPVKDEASPPRLALRITEPLSAGDILAPHLLEWRVPPEEIRELSLFREGSVTLTGLDRAVLLRPREKGAFLEQADLIGPGAVGYDKALLRAGEQAQAFTILNRGDFGALRPGDHVDLILTFTAPADTTRAGEVLVRRVAENIRITALSDITRDRGREGRVTLALSAELVTRATLAANLGSLRIAPRSDQGTTSSPEMGRTDTSHSVTDLFPDLVRKQAAPPPSPAHQVIIMRGGETSVQQLRSRFTAPDTTTLGKGGS